MRKLFLTILVLSIMFVVVAPAVFAGGDKVQGDKGTGEVAQEGPCPFGGDTPAGPSN